MVEPADGAIGVDELVDALAQAAFATMGVLQRVAASHDLSLTQLRVLAILRDRRLRMAELADHLGLERSTMSGLVDRAERRGLLRRAPAEDDGRAVEVALTGDGARLAASGAAEVARSMAPMTAALSAVERARLQALLEQMLGSRASAESRTR
jgi:DNA-binding MarR family transcriptional regulator